MTTRVRPITATEVARHLLEKPSASETMTTKQNARGDEQNELVTSRRDGESMYEWHARHQHAWELMAEISRERALDGLPDRDNGTPFDDPA